MQVFFCYQFNMLINKFHIIRQLKSTPFLRYLPFSRLGVELQSCTNWFLVITWIVPSRNGRIITKHRINVCVESIFFYFFFESIDDYPNLNYIGHQISIIRMYKKNIFIFRIESIFIYVIHKSLSVHACLVWFFCRKLKINLKFSLIYMNSIIMMTMFDNHFYR